MYGNGLNNPFVMQNMYNPMIGTNTMMRSIPMMNSAPNMIGMQASRGGLGSLLGLGRAGGNAGGIFSGVRTLNFGNLLTNASKALGVVKEAIPIVKEVGPMVGNMRQMLKIASIFKDETDTSTRQVTNNTISEVSSQTVNEKESDTISSTTTNIRTNDNEPNFFL